MGKGKGGLDGLDEVMSCSVWPSERGCFGYGTHGRALPQSQETKAGGSAGNCIRLWGGRDMRCGGAMRGRLRRVLSNPHMIVLFSTAQPLPDGGRI